jgi:hypothetical protein
MQPWSIEIWRIWQQKTSQFLLKIQEKQLRKLGDTPNGDTNHLKPNIEHHQIAVGYDFELEVYGIPDNL